MSVKILGFGAVIACLSGCAILFPFGTGLDRKELPVFNATGMRVCDVRLTTDLNPNPLLSGSSDLRERNTGVYPGQEGHVSVPSYQGPQKPTVFGVRAYACKGDTTYIGPLLVEVNNIDINSREAIVLR